MDTVAEPLAAEPLKASTRSVTFRASISNVDRLGGVMRDVVILEAGEARGHRMQISMRSLDSALGLLGSGDGLPAYLTHNGALYADRLLSEIGMFSDFYQEEGKIRAAKFSILPSFKDDEKQRYNRLFDLAEMMPETFGISIVFEGEMLWETESGDVSFSGYSDMPEGRLFDFPTVIPTNISSADFVDTPAATSSLFSEQQEGWDKAEKGKDMELLESPIEEVELSESASAELERRNAEEGSSPEPEKAEEAPAKKAKRKKKLEAEEAVAEEAVAEEAVISEEDELEDEPEAVAEEAVAEDEPESEKDALISKQAAQIEELKTQVDVLKSVFGGHEGIEDDYILSLKDEKQSKTDAIESYLSSNPSHSRMTAVLEVSKTNPELFSTN